MSFNLHKQEWVKVLKQGLMSQICSEKEVKATPNVRNWQDPKWRKPDLMAETQTFIKKLKYKNIYILVT